MNLSWKVRQALLTARFRLRLIFRHDGELNKRVEVECVLLAVAGGKRAQLTPDECNQLAMKLGVPHA